MAAYGEIPMAAVSVAPVPFAAGRDSGSCSGVRICEPWLYRRRRGQAAGLKRELNGHATQSAHQGGELVKLRAATRHSQARSAGRGHWRPIRVELKALCMASRP